jgi:hypothetical protein
MPELCGTLLVLELCYSMTRRFLDEQRASGQQREEQHRSHIGGSLDRVKTTFLYIILLFIYTMMITYFITKSNNTCSPSWNIKNAISKEAFLLFKEV